MNDFSYTQHEVDKLCNYSFNVGKQSMLRELLGKNVWTLPQIILLETLSKELEINIVEEMSNAL